MDPVLLTERLALRPFTPSDVDNLLLLDGDADVMRYIDGGAKTRAEIEETVLPRFLAYQATYDHLGFLVGETRSEGEFVGWFGVHPVTPTDDAMEFWPDSVDDVSVVSLGYRLRRGAWGHGYATEGARAVVRWAFGDPAVRSVVATTMSVNTGSRRVMEKVGLSYVRTVHVEWPDPLPGTEHGEVEYRLDRAARG
ncbi:MAG: GNAT family N-acetyltransferase [Streptosporangiales bacterium]|nr:GNAT family N-acetyltransferase [Streptosporangiales bacterium]